MLFAQIKEAEQVFRETAGTYTLAIAILIALVILFLFGLFMIVRWIKPHVEKLISSHLLTMSTFRTSSAKMAATQDDIIALQKDTISLQKEQCDGLANLQTAAEDTVKEIKKLNCQRGNL